MIITRTMLYWHLVKIFMTSSTAAKVLVLIKKSNMQNIFHEDHLPNPGNAQPCYQALYLHFIAWGNTKLGTKGDIKTLSWKLLSII